MTKNEQITMDAVTAICQERRAAHRFPASALQREVEERIHQMSPAEKFSTALTLAGLVAKGLLQTYQAQNYPAYAPIAKDAAPISR